MSDELGATLHPVAPRREPLSVLEISRKGGLVLPSPPDEGGCASHPMPFSTARRRACAGLAGDWGRSTAAGIDYLLGDAFTVSPLHAAFTTSLSASACSSISTNRKRSILVALHQRWSSRAGWWSSPCRRPAVQYRLTAICGELFGVWHFPTQRPVTRERLENGWMPTAWRWSVPMLWAQVLTQLVVGARRRDDGRSLKATI